MKIDTTPDAILNIVIPHVQSGSEQITKHILKIDPTLDTAVIQSAACARIAEFLINFAEKVFGAETVDVNSTVSHINEKALLSGLCPEGLNPDDYKENFSFYDEITFSEVEGETLVYSNIDALELCGKFSVTLFSSVYACDKVRSFHAVYCYEIMLDVLVQFLKEIRKRYTLAAIVKIVDPIIIDLEKTLEERV